MQHKPMESAPLPVRWESRVGSALMILAALATIALLGVTAFILYKRFIPH